MSFWLALGTGQNLRYLPVHSMCLFLGPLRSKSLLAFHSITGCDRTPAFAKRGKKTAWAVWEVYEEVTPAVHAPSSSPSRKVVEDVMHK